MKLRETIWALAVALVICVAASPSSKIHSHTPISPLPPLDSGGSSGFGKAPVGAARGVSSADDPQPYDPSQVIPDINTLSGAQLFGLGSLEHAHNIFDPSLSFSELGQTYAGRPAGQSI